MCTLHIFKNKLIIRWEKKIPSFDTPQTIIKYTMFNTTCNVKLQHKALLCKKVNKFHHYYHFSSHFGHHPKVFFNFASLIFKLQYNVHYLVLN